MIWLAALALAAQDTQLVECGLRGVSERDDPRRAPEQIAAQCPEGHDGLQAEADRVLAQIDLPSRRLARFSSYSVADRLAFQRDGAVWQALPGQWLLKTDIIFPTRAAEYGATHMVCAFAARPTSDGALNDPNVVCLSDVDRAERTLSRALHQELQNWRLAPTPYEYCMNEQLYVGAQIITPSGAQAETQMPDPARLPDLCREGED